MARVRSALPDQAYFYLAKFLVLGLVSLFILSNGEFDFWPFIYWDMYSEGEPEIPETASRIELRVLDDDQNWHTIPTKDLYTLDDDSSSQPGGKKIIEKTFLKDVENFSTYRLYLINHLEKGLNTKIRMVEVYELTWNLNYQKYPPLDIDRPDYRNKITSFKKSDYASQKGK
ncbi:MAG: hypothetical protein AAFW75_15480 [Cyanobacteria bacterium J06636_16]